MRLFIKSTFVTPEEDLCPDMAFRRSASAPARLTSVATDELGQSSPRVATRCLLPQEWRTTVMLGGITYRYTRRDLNKELLSLGFGGLFNFLHLAPARDGANRGFAFLNFQHPFMAMHCMEAMAGYRWKRHQAANVRVAVVRWAEVQGLDANLSVHGATQRPARKAAICRHAGCV